MITSVTISARFMVSLCIVTLLGMVRYCFSDSHAFSVLGMHIWHHCMIHNNSTTSNQHAELQPMAPGEVFVNLCSQVSLYMEEKEGS